MRANKGESEGPTLQTFTPTNTARCPHRSPPEPVSYGTMTALQAISNALLSLHDDGDETPSDEFHFESEYVKSLLRNKRTPSPITYKPSSTTTTADKENALVDRWRTPVTIGAAAGRTVLGARDLNSRNENTPAVKPASSYSPPPLVATLPPVSPFFSGCGRLILDNRV